MQITTNTVTKPSNAPTARFFFWAMYDSYEDVRIAACSARILGTDNGREHTFCCFRPKTTV
jgi:hypothetical protein